MKNEIIIEDKIYEIRGKQVMLDSDLAQLYHCANGTKTINQAVNRHKERFPEDFYFQLTLDECSKFQIETLNNIENDSRSQVGTLKVKQGENIKYLPHAFTEQGVAMLATILRTSIAAEVSIKIMRAFVEMRKYISTNLIEQKHVNNLVFKHEDEINKIFGYFERKEKASKLYMDNQEYDAYSKIIDILKQGLEEVIIIDAYTDKSILDIVSKLKTKVLLITSSKSKLTKLDIEKYSKEYHNLTIEYKDSFHDRFIILDKKELYHLGTSINHAGRRTFIINKLNDQIILDTLLKKVSDTY